MNRFQGTNSASLCSLTGRYDNPIPPWFLAPIDCLKIPAQYVLVAGPTHGLQGDSLILYTWITIRFHSTSCAIYTRMYRGSHIPNIPSKQIAFNITFCSRAVYQEAIVLSTRFTFLSSAFLVLRASGLVLWLWADFLCTCELYYVPFRFL
jgi:hypothetical protein